MDPELKELLQENLKVAKANNHILKGLRRHLRISQVFKALYWIVILGIIMGGYIYWLQPTLERFTNTYETATNINNILNKGN